MIDILKKINMGKITEEQAYEIYDDVQDKFDSGKIKNYPQNELYLDNYEWTAFSFGISFEVLANWRKNGWPSKCAICGKILNYRQYGWRIQENKLVCIKCEK